MNSRLRDRNNIKQSNRTRNIITLGIIAFCSFVFTSYIMLNAYEQIFSRDIDFINALTPVKYDEIIDKTIEKDLQKSSVEHTMNRDQLRHIYIPQIKASIELAQSLKIDNKWFIRGNKAHIIQQEENNNVVIYLNQNWRTTLSINEVKKSDLVFLLSKDSNYIFKINEVYRNIDDYDIKNDETGIPHLTIISEDDKEYRIITAKLISSSRR